MSESRRSRRADGVRVFVLVLVVAGCATATPRVSPRPIDIVVSPTQRILVVGFIADAEGGVDVNGDTVRRVRSELRRQGAFRVIQADPVTVENEGVLGDAAYWRTVGEEYGEPLIVTGLMPDVVRAVLARDVEADDAVESKE